MAVSGTTAIAGAPYDVLEVLGGSAYLYDFTDPCIITEIKLTASDAGAPDQFGFSVAISGNTAIVGAPLNSGGASGSGSAYLYDFSDPGNIIETKLTASDAATADYFGYSVAISGNTAIVGAYWDDDAGSASGSAYLFDVATGSQIAKLTASDADADDVFGISVAISGSIAIVGAHGNDDAGSLSGSAYLFDFTDPCSIIETKLTASDAAAGDVFGFSVAISGNTAIAGAYVNDVWAGSAYLFDVPTGTQITKLTASDATVMDWFGYSVAINGTTAIVGAKYDDDACPGNMGCNSGSAYLFDFSDPCNIIETKLTASDAAASDYFGNSVAVSGSIAFAGAHGNDDAGSSSGSAYLFKPCSETDSDGDGVGNDCDNCPATPNPGQLDTDSDGLGDACDTDDDNDGVPDSEDIDPLDPYVCSDVDNDACDDCSSGTYDTANDGTDTDADGICDAGDNCPTDPDKTEPGICGCGVADTDTDSDGTPDCSDNCPTDPGKTEPGICGCGVTDADTDGDGVPDCVDNCPSSPNPSQTDTDGDGDGDACDNDDDDDGVPDQDDLDPLDPYVCSDVDADTCDDCSLGTYNPANDGTDTDGDGICDAGDNCPTDPDKTDPGICGCGTADVDTDFDGTPDCSDNCPTDPAKVDPGICGCGFPDIDTDADGVLDCVDNCPSTPNPSQTDTDADGVGDACDNDIDGDGIADANDNCLLTFNPAQSDIDADGMGDLCDICPADAMDQCDPNGSGAWVIDPDDGATIETPDGDLVIDIDPNDLDEFITISVTKILPQDPNVDLMIGTNPGWGQAVALYDLEPDGMLFDEPVTVMITADVTELNNNQRDRLGVYLWEDPNFVLIEPADCTIDEDPPGTFTKTCTVEIDHFSIYAVVLPMWWETLTNGDLTGEGATDMEDLLIMAEDWSQSDSIADIAPDPLDNFVNLLDFAALALHWLDGTVP